MESSDDSRVSTKFVVADKCVHGVGGENGWQETQSRGLEKDRG